ncbi:major capsid protein [Microvirus sp.]|nr:major capsid protein [Microvirus sp.]
METIKKQIGKNTLGGGEKMEVNLRTYNRSNHNLSFAWRSSMGVGTLVPCCKLLALPGDNFQIDLNTQVLTYPTVGPLFGSFKLQIDFFSCPIRLYNAMLHNNTLGIGLNMAAVKLPIYLWAGEKSDEYFQPNLNTSSILNYLGHKGTAAKNVKYNGVPLLAYWDIFKNYYANKQEENFYLVGAKEEPTKGITDLTMKVTAVDTNIWEIDDITFVADNKANVEGMRIIIANGKMVIDYPEINKLAKVIVTTAGKYSYRISYYEDKPRITINNIRAVKITQALRSYKLSILDDIREGILKSGRSLVNIETLKTDFWTSIVNAVAFAQGGLLLKTYQSDINVNYINSDWIEGDNGIGGITKLTAVDTSEGSFSIDTLNLAEKVYDMLNRIAVSGGTYNDWVETVYTHNLNFATETPVYIGGASAEIEFSPVVSTSATEGEPLGTLAGRGQINGVKNGHINVNIDEPSYIIGIASITPRVDYSQGNDWDLYLQTLDDLHKPALDGIGYQDLMARQLDWRAGDTAAVGKQPAWINYMSAVNQTHGTLAAGQVDEYMVLNRHYNNDYSNTYINPQEYTYMFAEQSLSTTPFWVQIGMSIMARRVMSAKQIPLM